MELNMHPISAHLPQAFVIVIPLLILGSLVTGSKTGQELVVTAKWLSILLPFAVLASMSLGVIDGLTRFKKINTPMLFRKVILGLVLLILSTAMALLVIFEGLNEGTMWIVLALGVGCFACQVLLGFLGGKLRCARLEG